MPGPVYLSFFKVFATRPYSTLFFFSDGGIRLNPPAASAAVAVKNGRGQLVEWYSRVMPSMSNNEAEYHGLIEALKLAERLQPARACFYLDSQIVIGQITGRFAVRDVRLKVLHQEARELIGQLGQNPGIQMEFQFIPREYNLLADALASDALLVMPRTTDLDRFFPAKPKARPED